MSEIERYVQSVLECIPRALPERRRMELDLRAHLMDRTEAGESPGEAVRHMGPPEEVAMAFLSQVRLEYAPLWRRVAAFAIDVVLGAVVLATVALVVVVAYNGAADLVESAQWVVFAVLVWLVVSILVLSLTYFPVLEAVYGQTLGKRAMGLCVTTEAGAAIGWRSAVVRRLPFVFEFFWLDAVFALFTDRRQRAFDKVASTIVVVCRNRGRRVAPALALLLLVGSVAAALR